MKENVVGIEISVNDWLGQGMEIIHTLRDIQSYVKLKFVTYYLYTMCLCYLLPDIHVTSVLMQDTEQ